MAVLKFIALSGTTEVTENLYIYEYGNDIMVIDCGFGFPGPEMYGVDVVIPDFTYLIQNKHKIKGVVVTHGHEDHLGALPFLLKEIKVPIYATKLVAGFIEDKFKDYDVKTYDLNVFDPDKDKLSKWADEVNLGLWMIRATKRMLKHGKCYGELTQLKDSKSGLKNPLDPRKILPTATMGFIKKVNSINPSHYLQKTRTGKIIAALGCSDNISKITERY